MQKVTDTQLLFLDNLIYLDLFSFDKQTIGSVINDILKDIDIYFDETAPAASMTKEQWVSLLTSFKDNPANEEFLKTYKAEHYITDDTDADGFRVSCFVNKNDKTDVVVVFRGSYGGTEWEDNLFIANDIWSEHMDKGVNYINEYLPEEEYGNNITVTGHSKGGNRAQYVTIVTDRIGRCVSFDGQGFSKEFIDFYANDIEKKKSKITSICAEYDFVNAMLTPIAGTIKYIEGIPDDNFKLNHCPNKVFDENGNLNAEVERPCIISTMISLVTQKPVSEMSEPMADAALELGSGKIAVPIFDLDETTTADIDILD